MSWHRPGDGVVAIRKRGLILGTGDGGSSPPAGRTPVYKGLGIMDSAGGANRDAAVRDDPRCAFYVWRKFWYEFESNVTPGAYVFDDLDDIVDTLMNLDNPQLLSLVFFPGEPDYIATTPGVTTWTNTRRGSEVCAVPWDTTLLARWDAFCVALSNHMIYSNAAGTLVKFKDHETLGHLNLVLHGYDPLRETGPTGNIADIPGYTRTLILSAIAAQWTSIRNAFPGVQIISGLWPLADSTPSPTLDQAISDLFFTLYGITCSLYQDNWAASRPAIGVDPISGSPQTASLGKPLNLNRNRAPNALQALTAWIAPFKPEQADNVANGDPGDGITFAIDPDTYNCYHYEIYVADWDNAANDSDLTYWAGVIGT